MGRKASEKKKRKLAEQKPEQKHEQKPPKEKVFKKVFAKLKPKKKEQSHPNLQTVKNIPPQKIFGAVLVLIMATILVVVGATLFQKAFGPSPLADFLPEQNTSALLQISTYTDHTQIEKALNILSKTEYSQENIKKLISEKTKIIVDLDIKPWLGRQVGAAELEIEGNESLSTVFFFEYMDKNQTTKFTENLTKEKKWFTAFLGDYIVVSTDSKAIEFLTSDKAEALDKLSSSSEYSKINSKMPVNKVAFLFVNNQVGYDKLQQKYGDITNSEIYKAAMGPLEGLLSSEGMALIAKDDNFVINSYMSFGAPYLEGSDLLYFTRKYNSSLTAFIPDQPLFVWGGLDAISLVQRFIKIFSAGSKDSLEVFDGILKNYVEKYLSSNVSLDEDISPLLKNEFLVALTKTGEKNVYTIIVELDDPESDALKLQKIANNFVSSGAVFEPHIEEHDLPDGTKSREIVASQKQLVKSESKYKDYSIYEAATEDASWGVYYSVATDKAVISTDRNSLIESLKLIDKESQNSFEKSENFKSHFEPLLSSSEDVVFADIEKLIPNTKLVKSISTGREYFAEGILANYFINVR